MAGSRREFYLQNLLDAINGGTATYPDLVAGTREEKYFQNMIDAASGNDLTYPDLVPVWSNPEGWYEQLVLALQNGGGGGSYELLASKEVAVSTTSASATSVVDIALPNGRFSDGILYVKIRDKAGKRNGYIYGSDNFCFDLQTANGGTSGLSFIPKVIYGISNTGKYVGIDSSNVYTVNGGHGVYVHTVNNSNGVRIYSRYNTTLGTIDGTFIIDVYKLAFPDNSSL